MNERWRDDDRQRWDPNRDRYRREGWGRQDYGQQNQGRQDYGGRDYGRSNQRRESGRQDYGRDESRRGEYGRFGRDYGRDWGREDYGRSYRGEDYGRGDYGSGSYGSESYGSGRYGSGGYGPGSSYTGGAYGGYGYGGYGSSNYSEPSRDRDWGERYSGSDYRWGDDERERYTGSRGYGYQDYGAGSAWSAGLGEWSAPIADWRSGYREDWRRAQDYRGERGERGWGMRGSERGERGWWDRTKDEVRSWMGDEEAERRRREDASRMYQRGHMGRGPKNYARSDQRIIEDISDQLTEDWMVDASEIEVSVVSGEVTLSGTVDSREAKRRAENIAAEVTGVKDVQNNLRVRQQSTQTSTGVGSNLTGSSSAALEQTTGVSSGQQKGTQPKH